MLKAAFEYFIYGPTSAFKCQLAYLSYTFVSQLATVSSYSWNDFNDVNIQINVVPHPNYIYYRCCSPQWNRYFVRTNVDQRLLINIDVNLLTTSPQKSALLICRKYRNITATSLHRFASTSTRDLNSRILSAIRLRGWGKAFQTWRNTKRAT